MSEIEIDYVVVSEMVTNSTRDVLAGITSALSGSGHIVVCRRIPDDAPPSRLGEELSAFDGRPVDVTVSASLSWLDRALATGLGEPDAAELIVRVPWPPTVGEETTLVMATLSAPSLRLAVEMDASSVLDVFDYFNRLGHRWIALPRPGDFTYAIAVARLGRLWLFDPRTRAWMEPVVNALGVLFANARAAAPRAWPVQVIDASDGACSPPLMWTPSLHAALRAGAAIADLHELGAAEVEWRSELERLCAMVDHNVVRALAVASVEGSRT